MSKIHSYLEECAKKYYAGSPCISDEVFDRLAEASGYNAVGAKQHEHLCKHYYPMYSLQKFYEGEGKNNPLAGEKDISYSHKLDGAAIEVLYIDGKLSRVITRGDGKEGTDITNKFLDSGILPKELHHTGVVQIDGEIAAPLHVPNARNYAAGALNLKDLAEFKTRAIEFFAYSIRPAQYETYEEDMDLLERLGFNTVKQPELDKRYPTDGVVFRVNSNKRFEELGYTSKHPRGAYALKARPEGAETTIKEVVWQVGKSGKVTPVAILDPVVLGDATISRATLNNPGFIEDLDIQIGDTVHIIRSGEIIPCITHKVE
jgi:NAD-dependent DNA ligase